MKSSICSMKSYTSMSTIRFKSILWVFNKLKAFKYTCDYIWWTIASIVRIRGYIVSKLPRGIYKNTRISLVVTIRDSRSTFRTANSSLVLSISLIASLCLKICIEYNGLPRLTKNILSYVIFKSVMSELKRLLSM